MVPFCGSIPLLFFLVRGLNDQYLCSVNIDDCIKVLREYKLLKSKKYEQ